ncbi:MAG: hypothetical protein AAF738_08175, partial [Bacteroidota bacterium]
MKNIFVLLILTCFSVGLMAQNVGSANVCHVVGNPNEIAKLQNQTDRQCQTAIDENGDLWCYNRGGKSWSLCSNNLLDDDTFIDNITNIICQACPTPGGGLPACADGQILVYNDAIGGWLCSYVNDANTICPAGTVLVSDGIEMNCVDTTGIFNSGKS